MDHNELLSKIIFFYEEQYENSKKFIGGPYTHTQIEYAFGIAYAILHNESRSLESLITKIRNLTFKILNNRIDNDKYLLSIIRGEIIKLGDERLQRLLKLIHEKTIPNETGGTPYPVGVPKEVLLIFDQDFEETIKMAFKHRDISTSLKGSFRLDRSIDFIKD